MTRMKPKPGITYECYMGYTDDLGVRVRRKRRYIFKKDRFLTFYLMYTASGRGYAVAVPKEKFEAHFIPVNPID